MQLNKNFCNFFVYIAKVLKFIQKHFWKRKIALQFEDLLYSDSNQDCVVLLEVTDQWNRLQSPKIDHRNMPTDSTEVQMQFS